MTTKGQAQVKLVKYTEDQDERAALIPAALDFWDNDIHYWDRKTKNTKMKVSPYAFYRGTAPLYWYDFGQDERLDRFGNEHTATWLSGDYHAYNAGSFHREDRVVYGLNDFDESVVADYQLDLWRLAVSIILIAVENDNLSKDEVAEALNAMSAKYLERMRHFCTDKSAVQEHLTKDNAYGKLDDFLQIIEKKSNRDKMLDKWCPKQDDDGPRRFDLSLEKLGSATAQEKQVILDAMDAYWSTLRKPADPSNFQVLDISRRLLAGTGSLGTDRYYLLVHDKEAGVDRILDVKEQPKPAPYEYMGSRNQKIFDGHTKGNHALGVAIAHEKMSLSPDPFCGWMQLPNGKPYSVLDRCPFKGSFPALIAEAEAKGKFKKLALDSKGRYSKLAEQWAWVLASHHAYAKRDEQKSLEQTIVDLVGERDEAFKDLVRTVAFEYAEQVERDWTSFAKGLGADISIPEERDG